MITYDSNEFKALMAERKLILTGNIGVEIQQHVCASIIKLNAASDKSITLLIDSYGGRVDSCLHIYDAILLSRAPVHGVVTGNARSGAFFILQACHERKAFLHAHLMYHAQDMHERVDDERFDAKRQELLSLYKVQLQELEKRSKQSPDALRQWGKEERIFTTEEALSLNFIDELISLN